MKKAKWGFSFRKNAILCFLISFWFYFLFVLTVFVTREINQVVIDQTKKNAEQVVRMVSLGQAEIVNDSRLIFENWANEIESSTEIRQNPCHASIIQFVDDNDEHLYYGVADSEGDLLCSWVSVPENTNVRERKYFKDVLASKEISTGEYQVGMITESPSINLAYPVVDEANEIELVLILAIDLDWFDQRIKGFQLPRGAELLVVDYKGAILANYPRTERGKEGEQVEIDSRLLSVILAEKDGVIEGREIDGTENVYAFSAFDEGKEGQASFYSLVTLPEEMIFSRLRKMIILTYLVKGTFLISGLILSGFLFKHKNINN